MNWQKLNKITGILLVALALAVIADILVFTLIEYGRKGAEFVGCYAYDAMLIGFECQGFIGSPIATAWLNWPLCLYYSLTFVLYGFSIRAYSISILAFVFAVLSWAPVLGFIVSIIKLRRQGNA